MNEYIIEELVRWTSVRLLLSLRFRPRRGFASIFFSCVNGSHFLDIKDIIAKWTTSFSTGSLLFWPFVDALPTRMNEWMEITSRDGHKEWWLENQPYLDRLCSWTYHIASMIPSSMETRVYQLYIIPSTQNMFYNGSEDRTVLQLREQFTFHKMDRNGLL